MSMMTQHTGSCTTSGTRFHGLNDRKNGWRSSQCHKTTWVNTAPRERFDVIRYKAFVAEKYAGWTLGQTAIGQTDERKRTPSASYLTGYTLLMGQKHFVGFTRMSWSRPAKP